MGSGQGPGKNDQVREMAGKIDGKGESARWTQQTEGLQIPQRRRGSSSSRRRGGGCGSFILTAGGGGSGGSSRDGGGGGGRVLTRVLAV